MPERFEIPVCVDREAGARDRLDVGLELSPSMVKDPV
jgi:hypothetical protein